MHLTGVSAPVKRHCAVAKACQFLRLQAMSAQQTTLVTAFCQRCAVRHVESVDITLLSFVLAELVVIDKTVPAAGGRVNSAC